MIGNKKMSAPAPADHSIFNSQLSLMRMVAIRFWNTCQPSSHSSIKN